MFYIRSLGALNSRCIFLLPGSSVLAVSETADSMARWSGGGAGACSVVVAVLRQLVTGAQVHSLLSASGVHLVSRTCDGGVRLDHKKIFPRTANSSHHPTNGNGARG